MFQFFPAFIGSNAYDNDREHGHVKLEENGVIHIVRESPSNQIHLVPDIVGCLLQINPPFESCGNDGEAFHGDRCQLVQMMNRADPFFHRLCYPGLHLLGPCALIARDHRHRRDVDIRHQVEPKHGKGHEAQQNRPHKNHQGGDRSFYPKFRQVHLLPPSSIISTLYPSRR